MKHVLNGKPVKNEFYGLVNGFCKEPLFLKSDTCDYMVAREVWDRREEELRDCANRAGYRVNHKTTNGSVVFKKNPLKQLLT